MWPILQRRASPWPLPSAWRRCACGTAGGFLHRWGIAFGQGWQACCSSGIGRVPWLSAGVSVHRATGTLCALDSCSGPVRTPSGLGVCRQLGPRVFPDGRCCRYAGGRGVRASENYWFLLSGFSGSLAPHSCRDRLLWSCPFCLGLGSGSGNVSSKERPIAHSRGLAGYGVDWTEDERLVPPLAGVAPDPEWFSGPGRFHLGALWVGTRNRKTGPVYTRAGKMPLLCGSGVLVRKSALPQPPGGRA